VACVRYYPRTCTEELKKTIKALLGSSSHSSLVGPAEHKAEIVAVQPGRSVMLCLLKYNAHFEIPPGELTAHYTRACSNGT
jgi:hypothetical protein